MDDDLARHDLALEESAAFRRSVEAALRRVDAPEGFQQRIVAKVAQQQASGPVVRGRRRLLFAPVWRLATVALLLVVGVGQAYVKQERARVERENNRLAQQHFNQALRLTGHALNQVAVQLEQHQQPAGSLSRLIAGNSKENER